LGVKKGWEGTVVNRRTRLAGGLEEEAEVKVEQAQRGGVVNTKTNERKVKIGNSLRRRKPD